jgi:hypothetical protein
LLSFLATTFDAAASLAQWDRSLECVIGTPGRPRPVTAGKGRGPTA